MRKVLSAFGSQITNSVLRTPVKPGLGCGIAIDMPYPDRGFLTGMGRHKRIFVIRIFRRTQP